MTDAPKSKTLATWIAVIGGLFGLHRFYLHGFRDVQGWLFFVPTLVGWQGVQRMRDLGADDRIAWLLLPVLGVTIAATMSTAIVYGLTPDERWNGRFNPHAAPRASGWLVIVGVLVALAIGATALMATIAFSAQRLFEIQAEAPRPTAATAR